MNCEFGPCGGTIRWAVQIKGFGPLVLCNHHLWTQREFHPPKNIRKRPATRMKSFFNPAAWHSDRPTTTLLPQCGRCGLSKACYSPKMPASGKGSRSILFVAEAPGQEVDRSGKHNAGKPGKRLVEELKDLKVKAKECWKTNAIICHPPDGKASDLHVECCRPNLLKTIRELKPKVIVLLGGQAVRSLMPTQREGSVGSIKKWVGWNIPSHEHQAWICPTYHPAYVIREDNGVLDDTFARHLKAAIKLEKKPITSPSLEELKNQINVITNPQQARKKLKDLLRRPTGRLAFDYEGTGLKPEDPRQRIVSVSFCYEGKDTFACMMQDDKVIRLVSKILQEEKFAKIASNMKFEERWTTNKLGHGVANWFHDTMLAAHYLDNRGGISSVKFQAFIHYGIADYDRAVASYFERHDEHGLNRIDEIPITDLLLYNGLDSLLEFMVAVKQRKLMGL